MPLKKAGISRAFGAPGKYIQGPGELQNLPALAKPYGRMVFVLIDPYFYKRFSQQLCGPFSEEQMQTVYAEFSGQCCEEEIQRLRTMLEPHKPQVFVGIGGGKTCDTIKCLADSCGGTSIVCPTALSTDAPTSVHSVVYREDHSYFLMFHRKNPDIVLVDTSIAVEASARMFAAGMGDALATYLEARACWESGNVNNVGRGYRQTLLGMAVAKLSFDVLMNKGRDAYLAASRHLRTAAFEDVAEANTLLSGVGFENTGCSIAHGLQASLAILKETSGCMHGEQVAFGAMCQLVVENRSSAEFERIYRFCLDVGLPVTLKDLGITESVKETVERVVSYGLANKAILQIEPFPVTKEQLCNAIFYVDAYAV